MRQRLAEARFDVRILQFDGGSPGPEKLLEESPRCVVGEEIAPDRRDLRVFEDLSRLHEIGVVVLQVPAAQDLLRRRVRGAQLFELGRFETFRRMQIRERLKGDLAGIEPAQDAGGHALVFQFRRVPRATQE